MRHILPPSLHLGTRYTGGQHMATPNSHIRHEHLAAVISHLFGDPKALPFYLWVVKKYPLPYVFQIVGHVLSLPDDQIRTTRGALFNWIVRNADPGIPDNLPVIDADADAPSPVAATDDEQHTPAA